MNGNERKFRLFRLLNRFLFSFVIDMSVPVSTESFYLFFDFTYDHIGRILFGYGSSNSESPEQLSHIS